MTEIIPVRDKIRFRADSRHMDGRSDLAMMVWLTDDEVLTVLRTVLTDIGVAASIVLIVALVIAAASHAALVVLVGLGFAVAIVVVLTGLTESTSHRQIESLPSGRLLENSSVHGLLAWSDIASFEQREFEDDEDTISFVVLRAREGHFFNRNQTTPAIAFAAVQPELIQFLESKLGPASGPTVRTRVVDL